MPKVVYNLEFPSWRKEMFIHGYRFYRTEDYPERLRSLQHLVGVVSEFDVPATTGGHALTAYVEPPAQEVPSVLSPFPGSTALSDVTLLLGLFTGRDVFVEDGPVDGVIIADPRESGRVGTLACAIPYRREGDPRGGDIGFEEGITRICELIRTEEWKGKYGTGHFILLAKLALQPNHPLSVAYTQCWTIWEHLYGLHHRGPPPKERVGAARKIQFLLREYGWSGSAEADRPRIEALASIRNSLVHEGRFPQQPKVPEDVKLFIELTGSLLTKILGLTPTNDLNTFDRLEEFLRRQE